MVTKVRTIDFLPEVFRTDTNAQFLAATLDQLVQQPDLHESKVSSDKNTGTQLSLMTVMLLSQVKLDLIIN